jgi:hypothetical protein
MQSGNKPQKAAFACCKKNKKRIANKNKPVILFLYRFEFGMVTG